MSPLLSFGGSKERVCKLHSGKGEKFSDDALAKVSNCVFVRRVDAP